MDTTQLADRYEEFLSVAEVLAALAPLSPRVQARYDLTVAHVFLADRALILVARQILDGAMASLDNSDAMSKTVLGDLIASTSHAERLTTVRQEMGTLLRLLRSIPDELAAVAVTVRLVDRDGNRIFEEGLRWGDLIELRAEEQLVSHARLLAELLVQELGADLTG